MRPPASDIEAAYLIAYNFTGLASMSVKDIQSCKSNSLKVK
jgi:hypothetical protein